MPRIAIVGGGIAGLAAAHALVQRAETAPAGPLEVVLLEAFPRLGGKIATERLDGFLVEAGADSFSTRRPGALELVEELGLGGELLPTNGGGRVLVLRRGRLEELPAGLQLVVPTDLREVFRSRLLSFRGKARVALDLLRRPTKGGDAGDEAVAPFLRRHFGTEYLDRIAGPLLAGIHATDPERLSLRSAFPQLPALARRHGSLVRGARRSPEGAGPARVGLARGMGSLVDALARRLEEEGVELATGRPVTALDALPGPGPGSGSAARLRLTLAGGATLEADGAVLATPPGAAARLLEAAALEAARGLAGIPANTTATVSLGFRRADVAHALDALGFLVAAGEGRAIGGCTFSSSKFPGRAPAGTVLLRAYLGTGPGPDRPEELPADADALAALALADLRAVLGITGEPLLVRVHRFPAANPQYLVGHRERVAAVESALDRAHRDGALPPLALAGAAYHGLGLPDCIAGGRRAAERVLAGLCSPTGAVSGPGARTADP